MNACGLWIINPPYTLKEDMTIALNYLRTVFNPKTSYYSMEEL